MTLLEKLAPYLPYDTPIRYKYTYGNETEVKLKGIHLNNLELMTYCKPILRPLSDLSNNYMESWCEILDEFSPREYSAFEERFNSFLSPLSKFDFLTVNQYKVLIKNNFDVFSMIESGEAIDINTINK